jgi:hypothetical protein
VIFLLSGIVGIKESALVLIVLQRARDHGEHIDCSLAGGSALC